MCHISHSSFKFFASILFHPLLPFLLPQRLWMMNSLNITWMPL